MRWALSPARSRGLEAASMAGMLAGRPAKMLEGVLPRRERSQVRHLAVPDGPEVDDLALDLDAARSAAPALAHHGEDVLVSFEELDRLELVLLEHLEHAGEGLAGAVKALVVARV